MQSLIYDEEQARRFYREVIQIQKMGPFDADFFCVAARKKYMTQEEKDTTRLGDTTLLEKTPVREADENIFIHKLQKVDACLDHLYSHCGAQIPRECMVFYMNVNHTNMINALKNLKIDIAVMESELYDVFMKNGSQENIGNKIKRLDNLTLKAYQDPKNVGRGTWVDIDIDVEGFLADDLKAILRSVSSDNLFVVIQTHGGYHVLINTELISQINKTNAALLKVDKSQVLSVNTFIRAIEAGFAVRDLDAKEIKINQNAMVPIPGTLQGGKEVKLVY